MELVERRIVFSKQEQDHDYTSRLNDTVASFCSCNKDGPIICDCGEENDGKCK